MNRDSPTLIEEARLGQGEAIEQLIEACRPDVRRYALMNCRAADIEDAVQESLLILHAHIGGLRSAAAFAGWMFRIVKRQCLKFLRLSPPSDVPLEEIEEFIAAPDRTEIDLRLDLARAIQSLPPLYRDVIVLRDFSELSIGEIAARLKLNPATVKTRIHRGRQMIREHLLA